MTWRHTAPANLALIKYMGKYDHQHNVASNCSLSYTLPQLTTTVDIDTHDGDTDTWAPLVDDNAWPFTLSEHGIKRFLAHLARMKAAFNYRSHLQVRSCNNFPADCGLASSASSFAALTLCANVALSDLTQQAPLSITQLATLSRQGSGSSCRSLFSPWCIWNEDHVTTISELAAPHPYHQLQHHVIIVAATKKTVATSDAHRQVSTSLLFNERTTRAKQRQDTLLTALITQQWQHCYEIAWQEFWDMHALFATSTPPFGYMTADSLSVLHYLQTHWQQHHDGPIITMDAGANVHVLWRTDQHAQAQLCNTTLQARGYRVI